MANKHMKKMFNILSHQRNANQNYTAFLSHPSPNGYHQENKCWQGWGWEATVIHC
jgi:hypothetical protein